MPFLTITRHDDEATSAISFAIQSDTVINQVDIWAMYLLRCFGFGTGLKS